MYMYFQQATGQNYCTNNLLLHQKNTAKLGFLHTAWWMAFMKKRLYDSKNKKFIDAQDLKELHRYEFLHD